ncbi:MAG: hypothetical protein K2X27_06370 [Candidatus Obscuribacterales bacterium]|nr:hypothetical protein [Candidatus Obscuribacterales bacterium]
MAERAESFNQKSQENNVRAGITESALTEIYSDAINNGPYSRINADMRTKLAEKDSAVFTPIKNTEKLSGAPMQESSVSLQLSISAAVGAGVEIWSLNKAREAAKTYAGMHEVNTLNAREWLQASKAGSLLNARSEFHTADKAINLGCETLEQARKTLFSASIDAKNLATQYNNPCFKLNGIDSAVMQKRIAYLNELSRPNFQWSTQSAKDVLGSAKENKLFFIDGPEAPIIRNLEAARFNYLGAHKELLNLELNGERAAQLLKLEERNLANSSFSKCALRGAAKGLMVSGASMAAAYSLDRVLGNQFGYESKLDSGNRILLDGVAMPAIFISNIRGKEKFMLAASVFAVSRGIDYLSSSSNPDSFISSNLMKPNLIDGTLVTASALAPAPTRYKAAAIAASFTAGRAYNIVTDNWNRKH